MKELSLLKHVFAKNHLLPVNVKIPPGDDMGGVLVGDELLLVTVDQIVDGVHVKVDNTPIELIGRKAITRNLSDIAAMAGRPTGGVATGCLPRDWDEKKACALFESMREVSDSYGCPLIGGDISIWDGDMHLSVTLFAEITHDRAVLRSGAKVGDKIYVTGEIGGAWREDGGGRHLTFEPRVKLAQTLHRNYQLNSMIDLSDGLGTDLRHIAEMSDVNAVLNLKHLPVHEDLKEIESDEEDQIKRALTDGEDYELCFSSPDDLPSVVDGVKITCVGEIVEREVVKSDEGYLYTRDGGSIESLNIAGFEHG